MTNSQNTIKIIDLLANEIEKTNLFEIVKAREGNFDERTDIDDFSDHGCAVIIFENKPGISSNETERFITYLMTEFNNEYSFAPITLTGYKRFMPNNDSGNKYTPEFVFEIQLEIFNPWDKSTDKRVATDTAIIQTLHLVKKYKDVIELL